MTAAALAICGVLLALFGAYLALQAYDPDVGISDPLQSSAELSLQAPALG